MKVSYGNGKTKFGPGILIELDGDEVATAISNYLKANSVDVTGPRTITVNGDMCEEGQVYVDPSGQVVYDGNIFSGHGDTNKR